MTDTTTFTVALSYDDTTYAEWTAQQINAQIAKLLHTKAKAWATNDTIALELVARINDNNAFDGWGFALRRFQGLWICGCRVERYVPEFKSFPVAIGRETAARAIAEVCLLWLQNAEIPK